MITADIATLSRARTDRTAMDHSPGIPPAVAEIGVILVT
jgi:hypothetical protein